MNFKYISENAIEDLSLHDCIIEGYEVTDNKLILRLVHMNVMPEHPLNEHSVAKCSGPGELIFEEFKVMESILYEGDKNEITVSINDLLRKFEILKVTKVEGPQDYFIYNFFGESYHYNRCFSYFVLSFRKSIVCWNELIEDAWFVDFGKK